MCLLYENLHSIYNNKSNMDSIGYQLVNTAVAELLQNICFTNLFHNGSIWIFISLKFACLQEFT